MYCLTIIILMFGATASSIRSRDYDALILYFGGVDKIPPKLQKNPINKGPNFDGSYALDADIMFHPDDSVVLQCSASYPIMWLGHSSNDRKLENIHVAMLPNGDPFTKRAFDTIYYSIIRITNLTQDRNITCAQDYPNSTLRASIRLISSKIKMKPENTSINFVRSSFSRIIGNEPKEFPWIEIIRGKAFRMELDYIWYFVNPNEHDVRSESLTREVIRNTSVYAPVPLHNWTSWMETIALVSPPLVDYNGITISGNFTVEIVDKTHTRQYLSKTFEIIQISAIKIHMVAHLYPLNNETEISAFVTDGLSQFFSRKPSVSFGTIPENGSYAYGYFVFCSFHGNPVQAERAFMYRKNLQCPVQTVIADGGNYSSSEGTDHIPLVHDGASIDGSHCTDSPANNGNITVLPVGTAILILVGIVKPSTHHYGCFYNLTGDRDRGPVYSINEEIVFLDKSSLVTEDQFAKLAASVAVIGLSPEEIIIGDNVTLRCTARIDKYPLLYWQLGDRKVSNYDDPGPGYRTYTAFTLQFQIFDLIISNINESEHYTCWAEEPEYENIIRLPLPVHVHVLPEPPSFGPETSNNTVIEAMLGRGFVNISCDARGSPKPRIEWFKLSSSASNNLSSKKNVTNWSARAGNLSTLSVPLSDTNNSGVYQCAIRNRRGNAQQQFRVIITSPVPWGLIIAVVVSVVATGAVLAVVISKCYKTIQKKRRLKALYQELKRQAKTEGAVDNLDETIPVNEQVDALPFDFRYEIPQKAFEITNVNVGKGAFGKVTLAYLLLDDGQKFKVAAKSLNDWMDKEHQKALIDELKMMMHIGPHVNVLSLLAMHTKSMENGVLYAFTEYCQFNSLQNHLRQNSPPISKRKDDYKLPLIRKQTISDLDLLSYSYQVANGMAYLTSKNVVHRDLALRNVLLTDRSIVKIADFGLARPIGQNKIITDEEGRVHPNWQPLESIKTGEYAEKSDVWSFGIVLWEIFTFGDTPYKKLYKELAEKLEVSPSDVSRLQSRFLAWLEHGSRLEQPAECPEDIFELMKECWHDDCDNRPSFSTCQEKIKNAIFIRSADYLEKLENLLNSMTHVWVVPQYYNISPAVALRREENPN